MSRFRPRRPVLVHLMGGPRHPCKHQANANENCRYEAPRAKAMLSLQGRSFFCVFSEFAHLLIWEIVMRLWPTRVWKTLALGWNFSFFYRFGCINDSSECFALHSGGRALPGCNKASPRGTAHPLRAFFVVRFRRPRLMQSGSFFTTNCGLFQHPDAARLLCKAAF